MQKEYTFSKHTMPQLYICKFRTQNGVAPPFFNNISKYTPKARKSMQ